MLRIIVASGLAWGLLGAVALADDWMADKLRGQVLQLVGDQWQPLQRGMVVPDSRVIRTLATGRVTFTRGNETVDIAPNTQIQIYDKGGRKPFTTVKQYFGTVSVEAEVQQVQHFAVQTPYLAAVVKGTRFTVTSGKTNASVSVQRGHVEVDDHANKTHVTIAVGQSASVDTVAGGQLELAGKGKLPLVLNAKGEPIEPKIAPADLKVAKSAGGQARLLKTQEAKAAAEAVKKAAQAAEKEAKDAAKDADKAAKDAQKDADKAAKDAAKSDGSNSGSNSGQGSNSEPGGGSNSGSGNSQGAD